MQGYTPTRNERQYDGLVPGSIPNPGLLGFTALSVSVTSGPNFVTSASSAFPPIQPGTTNFLSNLAYPSDAADFVIGAAPPGVQPLGPISQQFSTVTYFDYEQGYSPGTTTLAQSVAVQSGRVPALTLTVIPTGLARAMTLIIGTQDGAAHNIAVAGTDPGLPGLTAGIFNGSALAAQLAFGDGTIYSAVTWHLWPSVQFEVDSPYYYSARLYF